MIRINLPTCTSFEVNSKANLRARYKTLSAANVFVRVLFGKVYYHIWNNSLRLALEGAALSCHRLPKNKTTPYPLPPASTDGLFRSKLPAL